jgi:hypothetical protein
MLKEISLVAFAAASASAQVAAPPTIAGLDGVPIQGSWTGGFDYQIPNTARTMRFGTAFSANLNAPVGGVYKLDLTFEEPNKTGSGQRKENVSVGPTQIVSNYDVYSQAGGVLKQIIVSTFVPLSSGPNAINFSGVAGQNAVVSKVAASAFNPASVGQPPPPLEEGVHLPHPTLSSSSTVMFDCGTSKCGAAFGENVCTISGSVSATLTQAVGATTVRFWFDDQCSITMSYDKAVITGVNAHPWLKLDPNNTQFRPGTALLATIATSGTQFQNVVDYSRYPIITPPAPTISMKACSGSILPGTSCQGMVSLAVSYPGGKRYGPYVLSPDVVDWDSRWTPMEVPAK